MKSIFKFKAAAMVLFALISSASLFAQQKPVASPQDSVSAKLAGSQITINYGSPSVKGRKVFGGLEAYGKVWRAGANWATVFTTSKDIKVEGKLLPAGTYGLFAIPTETTWIIIFNKTAKQWGAFKYEESKDALRVTVKPTASEMNERLVYKINAKGFSLNWDKLSVPVSVK